MEKSFPSLTSCSSPSASWLPCAGFSPPCASAAGPVMPDRSRAVQCSTAWGEETGQGDAFQQKLGGLNVCLIFCVGVGHSGIFSSHPSFALADPAGVKPLDGHGGAALGLW